MKILLVNPRCKDDINTRLPESVNRAKGIFPPLGLAYIASMLQKNNYKNVAILDAEALNLTNKEINAFIKKFKADIVGITCMTSTFPHSLKIAKYAKNLGAITVFGGPHTCAFPKECISFAFIDFIIVGEGEEAFLKLVKTIERKLKEKTNLFKNILGLVYKEKGKIKQNGIAVVKNIDKLPYPALDLLPMKKYFSVINDSPFITMMSSRGCPFMCGFCYKQPTDKYVRMRNPKFIAEEIKHWIKIYNIKEVMFYDDVLTLNKKHINGICDEIIKRKLKIKWEGPTRVDLINEDLLKKMKKAGCYKLRFGVESGDKRILALMRKKTDFAMVKKAFELCRKIGIETFAYFIIGYYSDNEETMNNTINFALKLNPDWTMFTIATPLPKTDLFEKSYKAGLIDKNYWREFAKNKQTKRIPYLVKDADIWIKKAYLKFYLRPQFIINKILKINSVYALKKQIKGALSIINI